ncbi:hypothetical protein SK128_024550, partial [Halocaridina rubra]
MTLKRCNISRQTGNARQHTGRSVPVRRVCVSAGTAGGTRGGWAPRLRTLVGGHNM